MGTVTVWVAILSKVYAAVSLYAFVHREVQEHFSDVMV
jgi:hypothetical protein